MLHTIVLKHMGFHVYIYIEFSEPQLPFVVKRTHTVHVHVFSRKSDCLGVLCCFALFVCLTLFASFFLPSHLSFKNM